MLPLDEIIARNRAKPGTKAPKDRRLELRITADALQRLDAIRRSRHFEPGRPISRAEVIRRLIMSEFMRIAQRPR